MGSIYMTLISLGYTVYYNALYAFLLLLYRVTHPFTDPWKADRKIEPPASLKDPKYGTHKYIKVNNVMLHYLESGDPTKPLMIFLHGFPEFWYTWRHQIVEFNKDYWCIAVDLRGFGDSEKPEQRSDYKIDTIVEDIRDLVKQLGRDKCILLGHDFGGLIAWRYYDLYPETLSGLVVLCASSGRAWKKAMATDKEQFKKSWYVFLFQGWYIPELVVSMNNMEIFDTMCKQSQFYTKDDIECYKHIYGRPEAFTPAINYYRANAGDDMPAKRSDGVNVPCLNALGDNDPYLSKTNSDLVKAEYPKAECILIENFKHFLEEDPNKINSILRQFLKKHSL